MKLSNPLNGLVLLLAVHVLAQDVASREARISISKIWHSSTLLRNKNIEDLITHRTLLEADVASSTDDDLEDFRQTCCQAPAAADFDSPDVLKSIYGEQFEPGNPSGAGEIVVLGMHNSGTSATIRLLSLLGAFIGNREGLAVSEENPWKWWEQFQVFKCHDKFIAPFGDPRFRTWHAQDFNLSSLTQQRKDAFDCFARETLKDLRRHRPFAMKDPRQALVMPLWRDHLTDLVCVFSYRDPLELAMSLAANRLKSSPEETVRNGEKVMIEGMAVDRWLHLWDTMLRQGLYGCRGVPVVLVTLHQIIKFTDDVLFGLKERLERAGVRGLYTPAAEDMEQKFKVHAKDKRDRPEQRRLQARSLNATALAAAFSQQQQTKLNPFQNDNNLLLEQFLRPEQMALRDAMIYYIRQQWSSDVNAWSVQAEDVLDLADRLEKTMTGDSR